MAVSGLNVVIARDDRYSSTPVFSDTYFYNLGSES